jgi:hypothetical protein
MSDALHRLTYDATIDDVIDVAWRLANRTHAFRKQVQTNVIVAGAAAGVVFFAVWIYNTGASPLNLVLAAVAAVLFGIVFAAIFRGFFDTEFRKQQRKIITEQFGGKPAIQCELELRPDAIWTRQAGMEMLFPWALCTSVKNNPDDIEMNFTPGICVVRNRHFASAADRQAFLETARQLSAKRNE